MKQLTEMTLVGLADFYSYCDSKHDEHGREECVKEIRRRQAMLDFLEGVAMMAEVQGGMINAREFAAAYAAAKGDR